jgi:hypothetical protein
MDETGQEIRRIQWAFIEFIKKVATYETVF